MHRFWWFRVWLQSACGEIVTKQPGNPGRECGERAGSAFQLMQFAEFGTVAALLIQWNHRDG